MSDPNPSLTEQIQKALDGIGLDVDYPNINDFSRSGLVRGVSEKGKREAIAAILAAVEKEHHCKDCPYKNLKLEVSSERG